MLDIPDLGIDAHLDAGAAFRRRLHVARGHERRVRVGYRGGQVEHAADGHGVLEGGGVEGDEGGAGVGECGGAREGQLKGGFEEEAAEDHEVVAVTVLGLHDLHGLDLGGGHPEGVVWFPSRGVGV